MITLLHGNYSESSRKEFIRLKEESRAKDVRALNGATLDLTSLTQAIESHSLFSAKGGPAPDGRDVVIFIENLFGKLGRKTKLIESLTNSINKSSADIILWEDKEVGASVTKNLQQAKITLFKVPSLIFQLLDGIAPDAARLVLPLYTTVSQTEVPELIFAMIVRRIRQLILISDGIMPERLQGWQLTRLTRQAKLFTMDRLVSMYKQLLDMEFSVKNGSSPFTLKELTEQFLLEL
jgi:hypothetical protein